MLVRKTLYLRLKLMITSCFPILLFSVICESPDVSCQGGTLALGGSPSLAHLIKGVASSLPHPTDANRTMWDARYDTGPFDGPGPLPPKEAAFGASGVENGADHVTAMELRAAMDADPISTGVFPLGSGSDFTVFLQRIGVRLL